MRTVLVGQIRQAIKSLNVVVYEPNQPGAVQR